MCYAVTVSNRYTGWVSSRETTSSEKIIPQVKKGCFVWEYVVMMISKSTLQRNFLCIFSFVWMWSKEQQKLVFKMYAHY